MGQHAVLGPSLVIHAHELTAQVEGLLADHGQLPPPPPDEVTPAPTEEQVQAADSVFAAEGADEMQQAGLIMGLYAGAVISHQLVIEAAEELKRKDQEDEQRARAMSPYPGCG